jgi:succinate dehydrogenase / fumarate reductase iron-sulfur subunit
MQTKRSERMRLHLLIWRQPGPQATGRMVPYDVEDVSSDMSFLEMLDVLNENLTRRGEDPVAFDSDCREGICGMCGLVINGRPHGPNRFTTVCQLHMRFFHDGDTIIIEPWRAAAFPVIKDLTVDRSAFDRIIAAGGYVSSNVGAAPEANTILVPKVVAEAAMDSATCIGCGACVASCKNASASLFVGAKITQLSLLPQGDPERARRAVRMVQQMDQEGFGSCSNEGECEAVCPKGITLSNIATMRREYTRGVRAGNFS